MHHRYVYITWRTFFNTTPNVFERIKMCTYITCMITITLNILPPYYITMPLGRASSNFKRLLNLFDIEWYRLLDGIGYRIEINW